MLHRNRLEFLGELAASLAHELNQPLNTIRMTCENLQEHLPEDDAYGRGKVEKIIHQIDRTSRIVGSIGAFSKVNLPKGERFSLHTVLEQVAELITGSLSTLEIDFHIDAAEELPFLEGDAVLLEQMVINLIMNGRDAITEKRRRGEEFAGPAKDAITIVVPPWHDRDTVTIKIRDTGTGIDGTSIDALAQPFFTTKGENGGTGLGLAICKKIADNIGARIDCSDHPDGGAEFIVTLPLPPQRIDEPAASERRSGVPD